MCRKIFKIFENILDGSENFALVKGKISPNKNIRVRNLNKDFWVFTGSSVGVVPIKGKGMYTGKIEKLGSVKAFII